MSLDFLFLSQDLWTFALSPGLALLLLFIGIAVVLLSQFLGTGHSKAVERAMCVAPQSNLVTECCEARRDGDVSDPEKAVFLTSINVTTDDVMRMAEIKQRCANGCAHPKWLDARKNRVTASRFAGACGLPGARKSKQTIISEMMSLPESNPNNASRFGVQNEDIARNAYLRICRERGRAADSACTFDVKEVGLCVWKDEPWLAASPDGICCENGVAVGVLEIKTARSWIDVSTKLTGELPCDWLYQVQGCMRLASEALGCRLNWCDLFLWTPQQCDCRRITFDSELWEHSMLPSLRIFYFNDFLPEALQRERAKQRRAGNARKRIKRKRQKR